jgi:hypothetical protein
MVTGWIAQKWCPTHEHKLQLLHVIGTQPLLEFKKTSVFSTFGSKFSPSSAHWAFMGSSISNSPVHPRIHNHGFPFCFALSPSCHHPLCTGPTDTPKHTCSEAHIYTQTIDRYKALPTYQKTQTRILRYAHMHMYTQKYRKTRAMRIQSVTHTHTHTHTTLDRKSTFNLGFADNYLV